MTLSRYTSGTPVRCACPTRPGCCPFGVWRLAHRNIASGIMLMTDQRGERFASGTAGETINCWFSGRICDACVDRHFPQNAKKPRDAG